MTPTPGAGPGGPGPAPGGGSIEEGISGLLWVITIDLYHGSLKIHFGNCCSCV